MKRYQDAALFLLVLAIVAQTPHVMVRAQPAEDATAPAPTVLIGDTVPAPTGYTEHGVLTTLSLMAGRPAHMADPRVAFPSGFTPHRFSESLAFGVIADAGGMQRLATVLVPPFTRPCSHHQPSTIPATRQAWPTNRGDLKP